MSKDNKVILAVSAHPDDIEFSSGGTLFKMKEKGYEIYLVVVTNGENGFKINSRSRKERIITRQREQKAAARYLGIRKVFFLGYKDGFLKYSDTLRKSLVNIIKTVKPSIIFSFDPSNMLFESVNLHHRDHRVVAEVVFDSVFAARNKYMYPGEVHSVSYFYFYGCDRPNHFENITTYIDKKIHLISLHRSQYYDFDSMSSWVKDNLCCWTKRYKYSEKFRVVKIRKPFITGVQSH